MYVLFPFIIPPSNDVVTRHGVFKSITAGDFEKKQEMSITIRPMELTQWLGKRMDRIDWEDTKWTVLETDELHFQSSIYKALFSLITEHWQYDLAWREYYDLPEPRFQEKDPYAVYKPKTGPKPKRWRLTKKFVDSFEHGCELLKKEKRIRIALSRWYGCYSRSDPLDTALDCCSSLEAVFPQKSEIRLRLALTSFIIMKRNKSHGFQTVYDMYGIRNTVIHGGDVPEIRTEERRTMVSLVSTIMKQLVEDATIPNQESINVRILSLFSG